jgi:hypothetical protein
MPDASPARTWKLATFSLGGLSVVLLALLVLQSTGRFDLWASLRGGAGGYAGGGGPAPVKLGDFKGDEPLNGAFRDVVSKRLAAAPSLGYTSPGVTGVVVGGAIKEATVTPGAGSTKVAVKVSLFVTKEPGAALLSVLSSTAALAAEGTPTPADLESYKLQAMNAAANAAYEDFLEVIR